MVVVDATVSYGFSSKMKKFKQGKCENQAELFIVYNNCDCRGVDIIIITVMRIFHSCLHNSIHYFSPNKYSNISAYCPNNCTVLPASHTSVSEVITLDIVSQR